MPRPMTVARRSWPLTRASRRCAPGSSSSATSTSCSRTTSRRPSPSTCSASSARPEVFDRDRVCLVPDHYAPNKDIKSAEQTKKMRDFAHEQKITHYWEQGLRGHRARAAARDRHRGARRPRDRRRLAYLHVRRARRVLDGRGLDGRGRGPRDGPRVVQGSAHHQVRDRGRAHRRRHGEGGHPTTSSASSASTARSTRPWSSAAHHSEHVHGRPHDHLEHGHRGRRQGGHHGGRRRGARLARGPLPAPGGRVPRRPGCRVRARGAHRRGGHQAVRELAAPAEQHASREREHAHRHRPGGHRELHERAASRTCVPPPRCCAAAAWPRACAAS